MDIKIQYIRVILFHKPFSFPHRKSNPSSSHRLEIPADIPNHAKSNKMQLQSLLTAVAALTIGISPALSLPEAQLGERAAACISGGKTAGSHCEAGNLGKLACSNDNTALVSSHTP